MAKQKTKQQKNTPRLFEHLFLEAKIPTCVCLVSGLSEPLTRLPLCLRPQAWLQQCLLRCTQLEKSCYNIAQEAWAAKAVRTVQMDSAASRVSGVGSAKLGDAGGPGTAPSPACGNA